MQLAKHDVIRIRAAALTAFNNSGLKEKALKGSKHNEDFNESERKFIDLFAAEIDRIQATDKIS